nr:uncharacterized protein I203_05515 [Kwoniella mangroviensis CBS 8507]OCF65269.1 hypothetical protein I203_05515 [Kwoniella mangroviensis CBS 8507]
MPDNLEYEEEEEEDLFGNDITQDVNTAEPIATATPAPAPAPSHLSSPSISNKAGPSRIYPTTTQAGPSTGRVYKNVDDRLRELQDLRRTGRDIGSKDLEMGAKSLRDLCMGVIKTNSARIWDIGDLEYPLIKPLIDEVPIEQLQEIESNSPHIKKDTDWLYEIFLLQDYPLFHERCQDRHGEPRTSGWRRMYKKAKEDFHVRQTQAADRVAARYKQLEAEKASKRIVVMDRIIPEKKSSKSGWGRGTGGLSSSGESIFPKPQSAIAKARLEAQRARVALTHASGRYIPPTPQRRTNEPTQLFKNPYLPTNQIQTQISQGPRIPPPKRSIQSQSHAQDRRISEPSSPVSSIPGSHPIIRESLPSHLKDRTKDSEGIKKKEERFKIDRPTTKFKEVRRSVGEKFVVPHLEKEKPKGKGMVMDFFAPPQAAIKSTAAMGTKRKERAEEPNGEEGIKEKKGHSSSSPHRPNAHPNNQPHISTINVSKSTPSHKPVSAAVPSDNGIGMDDAKINSVLFRKKKAVRGK